MSLLDIYRGRIAIKKGGKWYWAHVASGLCAVAHPAAPNRHHAICRDGRPGHLVPNAERFVLIDSQLGEDDLKKLETEKFGLAETIDTSEDV